VRFLPLASLAVAACGAPPAGSGQAEPTDPWLDPAPPLLEDADPDPLVFDAELSAGPLTWDITPELAIEGLAYGAAVPGPLLRVPLGARVSVHFRNDLPAGFDTTIHWHGIEGNNAADGTPVTQSGILPGDGFDYDMVMTRPGLFWYHPHLRGAQGVFEGLYATLVVEDPDEAELVERGVLPADERILVLSDLTEQGGVPISVEIDNAVEIMNGTEGQHLLVNGREDPVFEVTAGGAVRLRVVNSSITRFWRLAVAGHELYRVGGEGGLLDSVRIEGGTVAGRVSSLADGTDLGEVEVPLGFDRGEIVLAPGERADVVLVPEGAVGDVLDLVWRDVARGRHGMWMEDGVMVMGDAEDDGRRAEEPVATFRLVAGDAIPWEHGEGDPVLASLGRSAETVELAGERDWTGSAAMVFSELMELWEDDDGIWRMATELYVDGISWHPDHLSGPDQAEAPTAVHAPLGATLLWEVRNDSPMAHPFHLHGFSYQPVSFARIDEDAGTVTTWDVGVMEMEDTTLIPGDSSLFVRVRLEDRVGDGGAIGRWMRHCHIQQHGENGMTSELIVDP
jgi:FtsP/CotA-like multicopper oxidase with cupredoxin domain